MDDAPEPTWSHSKWTADELDGKTVEFRIPTKEGLLSGTGRFIIGPSQSEGFSSVQIETTSQGTDPTARIQGNYPLPLEAVDRISLHGDQTVAVFFLA